MEQGEGSDEHSASQADQMSEHSASQADQTSEHSSSEQAEGASGHSSPGQAETSSERGSAEGPSDDAPEASSDTTTPKACEVSSDNAGTAVVPAAAATEPAVAEQPTESGPPLVPEEEGKWFTEERLQRFAEAFEATPALWRTNHTTKVKEKTARGFAYLRLLEALGERRAAAEPLARAMALCREFLRRARLQLRAAALKGVSLGLGREAALARCPAWVLRAEQYLRLFPAVWGRCQVNQKKPSSCTASSKSSSVKRPKPIQSSPPPFTIPAELRPASGAAGARLMRRVVRGMRRAAPRLGLCRAAAAAVAQTIGNTADHVYALWCSMRALAMYKLRAQVARGDAPGRGEGKMDAIDWAVADLLLYYDCPLLNETSYQLYEQLRALLATFHLVQRCQLEPEAAASRVSPRRWTEAVRGSHDEQIRHMSALALQRRWHELKMDTRRRARAQLRARGQLHARAPPALLPLHQAIARRYPHVVTDSLTPWRRLAAAGRLARPTSERGPAPGDTERLPPSADSSASEAESAGEDDLIVVEKNIETIDLSEEESEDSDRRSSRTSRDMPELHHAPEQKPRVEELSANIRVDDKDRRTDNRKNNSQNKNTNRNKNLTRKKKKLVDKTVHVNKETVDANVSSPPSDVVAAFQSLDVRNVETTIVFESDEEEEHMKKNNDGDASKASEHVDSSSKSSDTASNSNARHDDENMRKTNSINSGNKRSKPKKEPKRSVIQSSDSDSDVGQLVIDDDEEDDDFNVDACSKSEASDSDVGQLVIDDEHENDETERRNTRRSSSTTQGPQSHLFQDFVQAIEREMFPNCNELSSSSHSRESSACFTQPDKEETQVTKETSHRKSSTSDKMEALKSNSDAQNSSPLLTQILQSKSIFEDKHSNSKITKVYSNNSWKVNVTKGTNVPENKTVLPFSKKMREEVSVKNLVEEYKKKKEVEIVVPDSDSAEEASRRGSEPGDSDDGGEVGEGSIDPQLLMYPVVVLTRIDDERSPQIVPSRSISPHVPPSYDLTSRGSSPHGPPSSYDLTSGPPSPHETTCDVKSVGSSPHGPPSSYDLTSGPPSPHETTCDVKSVGSSPHGPPSSYDLTSGPPSPHGTTCDLTSRGPSPHGPPSSYDLTSGPPSPHGTTCDLTTPRGSSNSSRSSSPPLKPHKSAFRVITTALSSEFVSSKRNLELLGRCKPCALVLRRVDAASIERWRGGGSRVAKKVELPDIEEVRRNNRSMLTAQVAPIQSKSSSPEAESGGAAPGGRELDRLLDRLFGSSETVECCARSRAVKGGPWSKTRGCEKCAARLLARPPSTAREARQQRAMLRHAARLALRHSPLAQAKDTPDVPQSKEVSKKHKKKKKSHHAKPPPPPPPPPSPPSSPVDPEEAAREWQRQKNIAAEKFGVKPRCLKRKVVDAPEQPDSHGKVQLICEGGKPEDVPKNPPQPASKPADIFNPSAVADLNRKLGTLAENPPDPTGPDQFLPVITNVQSLAPPQKQPEKPPDNLPTITLKRAEPVYASYLHNMSRDPKFQQQRYVIMSSQSQANYQPQTTQTSPQYTQITNRPQALNVQQPNVMRNMPQVVDVAGGISLPAPHQNDQVGLHLVVQQGVYVTRSDVGNVVNPMMNASNLQTNTLQITAQSFQNTQNTLQINAVQSAPQSLLMQDPSTVQPGLQQPNSMVVTPMTTGNAQAHWLFSSMQGAPSQSVPMVVRSVQSGPPADPARNLLQDVVGNNLPQQEYVALARHMPQSQHESGSGRNLTQQELVTTARSLLQGMAVSGNSLPQQDMTSENLSQQESVPTGQNLQKKPVAAGKTALKQKLVPSSAKPAELSPVPAPVTTPDKGDVAEQSEPGLDWEAPAVRSEEWVRGREPTTLSVVCAERGRGWVLGGRYLLLSEREPPPPQAAVWALSPPVRLLTPGEDAEPPMKFRKIPPKPKQPEPKQPPWLKVKSFARIDYHQEAEAQADTQNTNTKDTDTDTKDTDTDTMDVDTENTKSTPDVLAPPRVYMDDRVYQKLSDDPLIYAKLLVCVRDAHACRALLVRGAPLQLYCLRTGELYPLQAEPKEDVSRITLSGDEEVTEALVGLARALYQLPEPPPAHAHAHARDQRQTAEDKERINQERIQVGRRIVQCAMRGAAPAPAPSRAAPDRQGPVRPAPQPVLAAPRPSKALPAVVRSAFKVVSNSTAVGNKQPARSQPLQSLLGATVVRHTKPLPDLKPMPQTLKTISSSTKSAQAPPRPIPSKKVPGRAPPKPAHKRSAPDSLGSIQLALQAAPRVLNQAVGKPQDEPCGTSLQVVPSQTSQHSHKTYHLVMPSSDTGGTVTVGGTVNTIQLGGDVSRVIWVPASNAGTGGTASVSGGTEKSGVIELSSDEE